MITPSEKNKILRDIREISESTSAVNAALSAMERENEKMRAEIKQVQKLISILGKSIYQNGKAKTVKPSTEPAAEPETAKE
jgi:hypothetical protein